jgi:hypothetical protein
MAFAVVACLILTGFAAASAAGFIAGWMACAAFQAADDGASDLADGDWPLVPDGVAPFHAPEICREG